MNTQTRLVPLFVSVTLAVELGAQARPVLEAATTLSTATNSRCTMALNTTIGTQLRGFRAQVVNAPLTFGTTDATAWPVVALAYSDDGAGKWGIDARAAAGAANGNCAALSDVSRAYMQVSRRFARSGVALSYGAGSLSSLDPTRDREGFTATVWRDVRNARLSFDVRSHVLGSTRSMDYRWSTIRVPIDSIWSDTGGVVYTFQDVAKADSVPRNRTWRTVDLRTRVQWALGRMSLDLVGGGSAGVVDRFHTPQARDSLQVGDRTPLRADPLVVRLWGRGDVRFDLSRYVSVSAGLAALPANPVLGTPAGRIALFGMGLNGLPRRLPKREQRETAESLESRRVDSSLVVLRMRFEDARVVEVSGEPTGWKPVHMHRTKGGWWEVPLGVPAGSYRMNVRIDGRAWMAPPGTVATRDEFGGEVGTVVLR